METPSSETTHPAYSDRDLPIVSYGKSFLETIDKYVKATFRASRIYIIASTSLSQRSNALADMKQQLGSRLVGIRVGLRPHTLWSEVLEIVRECKDCEVDLIVTLGGGKVTDAAKIASIALANDISSLDDLTSIPNMASLPNISPRLRREDIKAPRVPIICVPTTLTGAEYTSIAGATNDLTHVKWQFVPPTQSPSLVILDPSLTTTMPLAKWISSGVRAIDHCVETLCSHHCDGESYRCAKAGLEALLPGLLKSSKSHSDELEDRLQCQLGAMNSLGCVHREVPVGASHGIGHMLGPMGVGHGETSCILMPAVAKYNAVGLVNKSRQQAVADIIWSSNEIVSEALQSRGLTQGEADLGDILDVFIRELRMPRTLQEVGIERWRLEELADKSLKDDFLRTNPVPITRKDQVLEILEKVAG